MCWNVVKANWRSCWSKYTLYPNEHFYMITEDYKNLPKTLPTFRDPDTYLYHREYHKKIMIGIFEPNAKNAFKKNGIVPNNFSFGEFKVDKKYIKMFII